MTAEQQRELEQLANLPDSEIDTSDIPEVTDFTGALRGRFHRPASQVITVTVDTDILDWFAEHGEPLPARVNEVLRPRARRRG